MSQRYLINYSSKFDEFSGLRSKSCLSNNSKITEANLTKLLRKIEHYDKVFHAQGQGSLAVFKVTARDQGHYKGHSGAFVTYCSISFFFGGGVSISSNQRKV